MTTETGLRPAIATPEELSGRLFESAIAGMEVFSIYLGEQLGLYKALAANGGMTAPRLAEAIGIHPRYARELLEQQATAGFITVDNASAAADERHYRLPAGYELVLMDSESPLYVAPVGRFIAGIARKGPELLEAYRTGGGVPWEQFGDEARTGQADFNKPFFLNSLVPDYLSRVGGVEEALRRPGARAAEIGFGGGWAMIALAQNYPNLTVDGYDIDLPSVELANRNISEAGLSDRVRAHHRDAGDPGIEGQYDLVCAFECVHDMPDPVSVLRTMGRLAKPDGTIIVVDERTAEEFGNIGDPIERMLYCFSLTVCLPDGMSSQPSKATGTVMRPATFRGYALEAGFGDVEVLPLEHDLFRFYRLVR